jgi:hypothetical protein
MELGGPEAEGLNPEQRKAVEMTGRQRTHVPSQLSNRIATWISALIADPENPFYGSDWPFTPSAAVGVAATARLDVTPLLDGNTRQQLVTANALRLFPALPLRIVPHDSQELARHV